MKPHHVTMYPGEDVEIDFYGVGADGGSIKITLNNAGALRIRVNVSHGEDASSWDEHDFEVQVPT